MLWKKESRQPDALYVDILKPNKQQCEAILSSLLETVDQTPHPEKSDEIALEKRNEGNRLFCGSEPFKAMELYGDSLRYACPGSEHISLAYANRSACFLTLKMYDECLTDIELAKKAGYPEHLQAKLNDRKAKCLKKMQEDPQYSREKLTIEPDEKFPYLSNVAKIQRNDNGVYSMVAKEDIDVGQSIAIENPFFTYVRKQFGLYCNICTKQFCNLVPCEKCAIATFCPECQGHSLHEYECGLSHCGQSKFNSDAMHLVRSILLALKMFATADELMVFVEQMLKRPNQLPDNMLDDRAKYHAYSNSSVKQIIDSPEEMGPLIYPIYKTLLRIPYASDMFKTARHRRFLMHLIGQHGKILQFTAGISLLDASYHSMSPLCVRLIIYSYVKHSCNPNVKYAMKGGKCHWYSVKPIKKGEQITISITPDPAVNRKKFLSEELGIKCECSRCQGKIASPAQRQQLKCDPVFRYICVNANNFQPFYLRSKQLIGPLKEACVAVLQKYGQMDWCEEIEYVVERFHQVNTLLH